MTFESVDWNKTLREKIQYELDDFYSGIPDTTRFVPQILANKTLESIDNYIYENNLPDYSFEMSEKEKNEIIKKILTIPAAFSKEVSQKKYIYESDLDKKLDELFIIPNKTEQFLLKNLLNFHNNAIETKLTYYDELFTENHLSGNKLWIESDSDGKSLKTLIYDLNEINYKINDKNIIINFEDPSENYKATYEISLDGKKRHFKDNENQESWDELNLLNKSVHYKQSNGFESWNTYNRNGNVIHYAEINNKTKYINEQYYEYDNNNNEIHYKDTNGLETWSFYNKNNEEIFYKDSTGFTKILNKHLSEEINFLKKEIKKYDLTIDDDTSFFIINNLIGNSRSSDNDYHGFVHKDDYLNGIKNNTPYIGFDKLYEGTILKMNIPIKEVIQDSLECIDRQLDFETRNPSYYKKSFIDLNGESENFKMLYKNSNELLEKIKINEDIKNPYFNVLNQKQKEAVIQDMKINPDLQGEYQDHIREKNQLSENDIPFNKPDIDFLIEKINKNNDGKYPYFDLSNESQKKHYFNDVFKENNINFNEKSLNEDIKLTNNENEKKVKLLEKNLTTYKEQTKETLKKNSSTKIINLSVSNNLTDEQINEIIKQAEETATNMSNQNKQNTNDNQKQTSKGRK